MLNKVLKLPMLLLGKGNKPIFEIPLKRVTDYRDVEKSFARLFSSNDGQRVLSYLDSQTFMRAYGSDVSDNVLRYMEGQRALLGQVYRLIERGKSPQK